MLQKNPNELSDQPNYLNNYLSISISIRRRNFNYVNADLKLVRTSTSRIPGRKMGLLHVRSPEDRKGKGQNEWPRVLNFGDCLTSKVAQLAAS